MFASGTPYWSLALPELLTQLGAREQGLGAREAAQRLAHEGPNVVEPARQTHAARLLLRQFTSPLVLILIVGAIVSAFVGDWVDAATILVIVAGSAGLGFAQEYRASAAVERLRRRLALSTQVLRDGLLQSVPARDLVRGDIVELSAGKLVPADGVVLAARDFLVVESGLTGESFPVEKRPGVAAADAPLRERGHCVFLGSSVRSGTARVLIAATGAATAMGDIASRLQREAPETEFARGVRHFGEMLLRVMVVVVIAVLVANQWLGRPAIDSLLFAVALAVGLSPELLPAIVSVSLSGGARRLARQGVLVRRLEAIEDLGGMDVLCTDKTGTLTVGVMALQGAVNLQGDDAPEVLRAAFLNAAMETGIDNPMDAALVQAGRREGLDTAGWGKVDEIPYDFVRKRLTIVAAADHDPAHHRMVVKGAVAKVVAVCSSVRAGGDSLALDATQRERIDAFVREQGERGIRVLAVATRDGPAQAHYAVSDETGLELIGFLLFADPPKPEVIGTLRKLAARGVRVKMITGDSRHVAAHLARLVGLDAGSMVTGEEIASMRDEALWHLAERSDLFVEVEPAHKERIVRALQHSGHAVGFLGDGINDAPALHAADVGISVDGAVDVARETADIVLLRHDLEVLLRGIEQGRRTFANTMKYIAITTSANFGNMVSMALATPLLPFLPLTATQILLNNLLSDLPALAIATDKVDAHELQHAQRWHVAEVRRFMIFFGLVSSVFDLITFALLLLWHKADAATFHSAWFVVSLLTELVVVLLLRTRSTSWRSRPAPLLLGATVATALLALALPYLGAAQRLFGFVALDAALMATLALVVLCYAITTEWVKRRLWSAGARASRSPTRPRHS